MMQSILFVTGNDVKFLGASTVAKEHGIPLEQAEADITEIQSHDVREITEHKAAQAYEQFKRPLVVGDDCWIIPGLKGFPGPYMKYVNEWFTPEDWLRLTAPLKDRSIILRQAMTYRDETTQKTFIVDIHGVLLSEARGSHKYSHITITSFDGGKRSGAEYIAEDTSFTAGARHTAWHELCEWLQAKQ